MNSKINPVLDPVVKGQVHDLQFLTDDDTIHLNILSKNNQKSLSEIAFENVNAYYYVDDSNHQFSQLASNDCLNAISYDENGFGEFTAVKIEEDDQINVYVPNFAVNLKASSLYIDADTVRIDGKSYRVKY